MFTSRPRWILLSVLNALTAFASCGEPRSNHRNLTSESHVVSSESPYDENPDHPWNRVFRHFHRWTSSDGTVYFLERIEIPFEFGAKPFSLEGAGGEKGVQLLDEFLQNDADRVVKDPVKRAIFQRDLWAVFVATGEAELQKRLVKVMRRVALSAREIEALPDNLGIAVREKPFNTTFDAEHPKRPFLPTDLLDPSGRWVAFTRRDRGPDPASMAHVSFASGRAVFVPFMSLPKGAQSTKDYIQSMKKERIPQFDLGTQVALLRRTVLIDDSGIPRLSPLTESLQMRVFDEIEDSEIGRPFEFILRRVDLFAGRNGGLHPASKEDQPRVDLPSSCVGCHARLERGGVATLQTLRTGEEESRGSPYMRVGRLEVATSTDLGSESKRTLEWLQKTSKWVLLKSLW